MDQHRHTRARLPSPATSSSEYPTGVTLPRTATAGEHHDRVPEPRHLRGYTVAGREHVPGASVWRPLRTRSWSPRPAPEPVASLPAFTGGDERIRRLRRSVPPRRGRVARKAVEERAPRHWPGAPRDGAGSLSRNAVWGSEHVARNSRREPFDLEPVRRQRVAPEPCLAGTRAFQQPGRRSGSVGLERVGVVGVRGCRSSRRTRRSRGESAWRAHLGTRRRAGAAAAAP